MPTLEKFDPSRPLKAATFLRIRGTLYRKNDKIEYTEAEHRVLERLYNHRKITYGDGVEVVRKSPHRRFLEGNAVRREKDRADAKAAKATQSEDDLQNEMEATEAEHAEAERLAKSKNHADLFQMASGLAGVKKAMSKREIALALVRAGRGAA